MTMRVWTGEELNHVHPLPEGWSWKHRGYGEWMAVYANYDGDAGRGDWHVLIDEQDDVSSFFYYYAGSPGCDEAYDPPRDVALAVILASKGLDSLGTMADAMDAEADAAEERDRVERADGADWSFDFWKISACRSHAAMVRRGTVKP